MSTKTLFNLIHLQYYKIKRFVLAVWHQHVMSVGEALERLLIFILLHLITSAKMMSYSGFFSLSHIESLKIHYGE